MGIFATGSFIDNFSRVIIQIVAVFLGYSIVGLVGGFVVGMFIEGSAAYDLQRSALSLVFRN